MKTLLKALALTLAALAAPAAMADRVEFLGQTQLGLGRDRDVVNLGDCRGPNDPIRALKMVVRHAPGNIDKLVVRYGNGQKDELEVRDRFPAGGESRWIDLRGNRRCVERIIIVGDSDARFARPTVQFYGLR